MATNSIFGKVDTFLINVIFSKKLFPLLIIAYVGAGLFIVREDIGKISPTSYLSLIAFGLALLCVGVWGVRDKKWFAYSTQTSKKEAHITGYFALLGAIAVLFFLYFRAAIFS